MSKDLIQMAQDNYFDDFRLKRFILDGVRQKEIKTYKDKKILS